MKRFTYIALTGLTLSLLATACSSIKKQQHMPAAASNSIRGTVEKIQNGKDGYTATIRTATGEYYYATVSHANLSDPAQYRAVAIGEVIEVTGDIWKMESEQHITVRQLKARP